MTRRITVRVDDATTADLKALSDAGWSVSDAVRYALAILADAQVEAVRHGVVAPGEPVEVTAATVGPRPAQEAPTAA